MANTAIEMIRQALNDDVVRDAFNHFRAAFAHDVARRMKSQELQGVAEREPPICFVLDRELEKWANSMGDEPLPDVVNRVVKEQLAKPLDKL